MTDMLTIERLARQIAHESGCNYDAKRAHKAHWRRRARSLVVIGEKSPDLVSRMLRYFGWYA